MIVTGSGHWNFPYEQVETSLSGRNSMWRPLRSWPLPLCRARMPIRLQRETRSAQGIGGGSLCVSHHTFGLCSDLIYQRAVRVSMETSADILMMPDHRKTVHVNRKWADLKMLVINRGGTPCCNTGLLMLLIVIAWTVWAHITCPAPIFGTGAQRKLVGVAAWPIAERASYPIHHLRLRLLQVSVLLWAPVPRPVDATEAPLWQISSDILRSLCCGVSGSTGAQRRARFWRCL